MNIQNGDSNSESVYNTNLNENLQEQHFTFENRGPQTIIVHPNQDGVSTGNQSPKNQFSIETTHAFTLLFGCIGLALICIAFCVGASCLRRAKKSKKKNEDREMSIIRTKREDKIIEMIEIIKKHHTPEPKKKMEIMPNLESDFESDFNDDEIESINTSFYSTKNV